MRACFTRPTPFHLRPTAAACLRSAAAGALDAALRFSSEEFPQGEVSGVYEDPGISVPGGRHG